MAITVANGFPADATGDSHTIPNATPGPFPAGDDGGYTVVVTDAVGTQLESEIARLRVTSNPLEFIQHPSGAQKYVGESHTFEVSVAGYQGTPTYQWMKDSLPVTGAETFQLVLDPLALTDTGIYTCRVGDDDRPPLPYANSANAVLEVADPLAITGDLGDANLYVGEAFNATASFAGGLGTQVFQWYKDAIPIPSGTLATFDIPAVGLGDTGKYRCDVSDSRGIPLSTNFSWLSVFPPATIATQPASADLLEGDDHVLSIETTAGGGAGDLHYAWTLDSVAVGDDRPVIEILRASAIHAGTYRCEITDEEGRLPGGIVESDDAVITVDVPFRIPPGGQPQAATICRGTSHIFQMYTLGADGAVTYQWLFDDGSGTEVPISGAVSSALDLTNCDVDDVGLYTVLAKDDMGTPGNSSDDVTLTSASAQLLVVEPMSITGQPASVEVGEGAPAVFVVVVSDGVGSISYQWQVNGVDITDATTAGLIISSATQDDVADSYVCIVSDDLQQLTSAPASLTLIVGQPAAGALAIALLIASLALAARTCARS